MALMHKLQSSPSLSGSKETLGPRLRVTLLFVHLWLVLVGVPLWVDIGVEGDWLLPSLPVALFGLGLWRSGTNHSSRSSVIRDQSFTFEVNRMHWPAGLLVVAVPAALGMHIAVHEAHQGTALIAMGPVGLLLATVSLCAYVASALHLCLPTPTPSTVHTRPLIQRVTSNIAARPAHLVRIRLYAALFGAGAVGVGLWAPWPYSASQTLDDTQLAWAHLGCVVSSGLACAIAGLFLSNALGPVRQRPTRTSGIPALLAMALLGVVTFYLTHLQIR